jgi:ATP phosphoribosyltransferase
VDAFTLGFEFTHAIILQTITAGLPVRGREGMGSTITLGIPKGSLEESTLSLFSRGGFSFYGSNRSLWLGSNDPEIKPVLLRPQEIPLFVACGSLDCGLAGFDWITETKCADRVRVLADLCYSKRSFRPIRWVLAVAQDSPFKTTHDLKRPAGRPPIKVSTELKATTEGWLAERGIFAEVDFSWGATEAKVPAFADAIVECTETGQSLQANGLRILDTVLTSTTRFFANKAAYKNDEGKRTKLEDVALLLKSCLAADMKVSLHVQAPGGVIDSLKALIPGDAHFAVWEGQGGQVLLEIIVDKDQSRNLIPALVRNGAKKVSMSSLGMLYDSNGLESAPGHAV